jgi:uncharacterized membrane protein
MVEVSPNVTAQGVTSDAATGRLRRRLADPASIFLIVALTAGAYLACVVPHFGGIDEPAHFYRAYQISTGRFLPLHPDGSEFSGACVPPDVVRDVLRDGLVVLRHHAVLEGKEPGPARPVSLRGIPRCSDDPSQRFVSFSTFGSPVPYLPQAAAIGVVRSVGGGVDAMVLASRLAALAAYVAMVWLAIRRATRSRWAFCAVGLIPVALFQASASASHDAVTIALSLLVVSSALRLSDEPDVTFRAALLEALVVTSLLAACKPGYIVLSACYLLPLLGAARRRGWWPLLVVPVVGVLVSVLWNEAVGGLWRTDADLFGVAVDPDRQRSLLLHEPWTFGAAVVRTLGEDLWEWGKGLITLGPSVAVWPTVGVLAALVVLALVSVQRVDREPPSLEWTRRVLLSIVFVVGCVLVLGAQYVYWSVPGADVVGGMQARFFVPLLVLVPIVVGPRRGGWAAPAEARIPLTILLVPFYIALLVTITFRVY